MVVKVLAVLMGAYLVLFGAVAFMIYETGLIVVDVKNKVSGHRVLVPVPMMLVDTAMSFVPPHVLREADLKSEVDLKYVHAATQALSDCPDATFVEVETKEDHVVIAKRGDNLTVNVETPEDHVYLRVPVRGVDRVITRLAAAR